MTMPAVVLTHQVTYGGTSLTTVQPGADPVELPDAIAAAVVAHGLGHYPEPDQDPDPPTPD